jgi:dephospho-CoA kinase
MESPLDAGDADRLVKQIEAKYSRIQKLEAEVKGSDLKAQRYSNQAEIASDAFWSAKEGEEKERLMRYADDLHAKASLHDIETADWTDAVVSELALLSEMEAKLSGKSGSACQNK